MLIFFLRVGYQSRGLANTVKSICETFENSFLLDEVYKLVVDFSKKSIVKTFYLIIKDESILRLN